MNLIRKFCLESKVSEWALRHGSFPVCSAEPWDVAEGPQRPLGRAGAGRAAPVSHQVCHSPGPEVDGGRVSSPASSWPRPWAGRWAEAWRQTGDLDLSRLGLTVSGAQLQRPIETTQHFLLQGSEPPWRKPSRLN